jgi:hypothetical protein
VVYVGAVALGIGLLFKYHWKVGFVPPLVMFELKTEFAPVQKVCPRLLEIPTVGVTRGFTVITKGTEVTEAGEAQEKEEVNLTRTCAPFARPEVEKLEDVSPLTSTPFTDHWYCGLAPPLTGLAVNTTVVPAQIVFPGTEPETVTAGLKLDTRLTDTTADVAVTGLAQGSEEVKTTST